MKTRILLATLALSVSALGQSTPPPTITLEIPIEAAGHSFQFIDDYPNGTGTPTLLYGGAPIYDLLTQRFLVVATPQYGYNSIVAPRLLDDSTGVSITFASFNITDSLVWLPSIFGNGLIGFAVHEDLANHTFALVAPIEGYAFPVTKLPVMGSTVNDTDGNPVFVSLGFFNAFVNTEISSLSPATTVLVDLTAQKQAVANATDLRNPSAWVPRTVALPTRAATFTLGNINSWETLDTTQTYTLHTSSGSLQGVTAYSASGYDQSSNWFNEARVSGQVGISEDYWLTKDGTADSTPHFFMGPGTGETLQSAAPFTVPVQQRGTLTFTIGQDHYSDTLYVVQNGTWSLVSSGSGNQWQNMLTTWDINGNPLNYYFDYYQSQEVNLNAPWELVSVDSSNSTVFHGQTTDLRDGFSPFNPVPPAGQVSVSVANPRRVSLLNGQLHLIGQDGTLWAVSVVPGFESSGNYSLYWAGYFIGTPMERWTSLRYIPATAPASTTNGQQFMMHDVATDEYSQVGAGGENFNFATWVPESPITLSLPVSRWSQDLSIVTAAGGVFPIEKGAVQGLWTSTGNGAYFNSYGYFEATSRYHIETDWWVYSSNGNLGAPEFSGMNSYDLLNWASPTTDADNDGLPSWYEYILGTSDNSTDTDGDEISDFIEARDGTNPNSPKPILTVSSPVGAVWLN